MSLCSSCEYSPSLNGLASKVATSSFPNDTQFLVSGSYCGGNESQCNTCREGEDQCYSVYIVILHLDQIFKFIQT